MMHRLSSFRSLSTRHGLAALILALLPLATADAQALPQVRVTRGDLTIYAMRHYTSDFWRLTRADAGDVFEVLAVDGDQLRHDESNHYLVLLPRDARGTQWSGWIAGRDVEMLPPRPSVATTQPAPPTVVATAGRSAAVVASVGNAASSSSAAAVSSAASTAAAASAVPSVAGAGAAGSAGPAITTAGPPVLMPEVVLQFGFDRSELAEAAKHTLTTALGAMSGGTGSLSFALGGHADATGPDDYNQKLGLARASAVRQYIVEQLKVPSDRISVSSFGEARPVASNDSRSGRAENRRVVVTVTAAAPAPATTSTAR